MFTATVVDGDTFQFDPKVCPTIRVMTANGAMADFTLTMKSGTGTLTYKTLEFVHIGEDVGSNYSDGTPGAVFPIKYEVTATKR